MSREEPQFDIFFGAVDRYAVWVESVCGLSSARGRMEALAAEKPGIYFLFSSQSHTILGLIDTTSHSVQSNLSEDRQDKKDIA